ncbi:MAG: hypothetical protein JWQ84_261 [Mucilaginibacter sp.]|nr:hypothetical protein [Mucilaginibacter sp.]MDB5015429.1 hypothetical protein [Mucilaginibacter sp.]
MPGILQLLPALQSASYPKTKITPNKSLPALRYCLPEANILGIVNKSTIKINNNMQEQAVENQTRIYLYDLMNEAKEHGFKNGDQWELSLVTDNEKTRIMKDYYPAVATKIFPEILLQVFQSVKSNLSQSLSKEEQQMDTKSILKDELNYIVAFNPNRPRH